MVQPRSRLVSLDETTYYHCMSRCVRRAFLCGQDPVTQKSYEHRRLQLEHRLAALSKVFLIDVAAYAIMSNHYHVILRVNIDRAKLLTSKEVVKRWHMLFKGCELSNRYLKALPLSSEEEIVLEQLIYRWRGRLMDISWFMRCMNEPIARAANKEDECTGRFWEGRFKSQALLDEAAVLSCMAYVDLNPIRAGMAKSIQDSHHTSIQKREGYKGRSAGAVVKLMPFKKSPEDVLMEKKKVTLSFLYQDYIWLINWSINKINVAQSLPSRCPHRILNNLEISPDHWLYLIQHFESKFSNLVGSFFRIKDACKRLGLKRAPGITNAQKYFVT